MEEIINNVMQSPENTNPNVLRSQLSEIDGGSGSGGVRVYERTNDAIAPNLAITDLVGGVSSSRRQKRA